MFQHYIRLVHMAQWQHEQFKICNDIFYHETILSVVDFAENYTLQPHNEIQSQYYHLDQVRTMVHITYRHGPDSSEEKQVRLKESHVYISDHQTHNFCYVQHFFQLFYDRLIAMGIPFCQHWIWSEGCEGQFKNECVFEWFSLLHIKYKVSHLWTYFDTGHGKWEHDGVGTCMKMKLQREQMNFAGENLQDVASIVNWCTIVMG